MCNFGRVHHGEQFREIILNLDQWFRRRCHLKTFLIYSSGGPFVQGTRTICAILVEVVSQEEMLFKGISDLELWQPFCSAERNNLYNFGRGCYQEQFCEIILNLGQWLKRRCCLKDYIWSSGGPTFRWSKPIYAILKEGIMGNGHVKLYEVWTIGSGGDVL